MSTSTRLYTFDSSLKLEYGEEIQNPTIAYRTWGKLNSERTNAVLICHALTGNSDADLWFSGLFEEGVVNPDKQFIICSNVLGGCYGSTGPQSINPLTGKPFKSSFPIVTIRDMVTLQQRLLCQLGIRSIELAIGGSMGGMQILEWSIMDSRVQKMVLIGMGKAHSAWAIGISEAQRQAIYADKNWKGGDYELTKPPSHGLSAARMMAMLTYRTFGSFEHRFGRNLQPDSNSTFAVESYLNYQGEKLVKRFDAMSYVRLTQAMDSHDVSRGRSFFHQVLSQIRIPALVIGIESDLLYPVVEQKELASQLPSGYYYELSSHFGHDAFLVEFKKLAESIKQFQNQTHSIAV